MYSRIVGYIISYRYVVLFCQQRTTTAMPNTEAFRDAMMASGNRLLEAQALELKLINEKENRPGLLKEIRLARTAVDALASEYLESIRRCRDASTHETSASATLHNVRARKFFAAIQRPWCRRSQSTDRLEQLCDH
jgi:hypothetical protein